MWKNYLVYACLLIYCYLFVIVFNWYILNMFYVVSRGNIFFSLGNLILICLCNSFCFPLWQVFTFTHPNRSTNKSNQRYMKLQFDIPSETGSSMVHGMGGWVLFLFCSWRWIVQIYHIGHELVFGDIVLLLLWISGWYSYNYLEPM